MTSTALDPTISGSDEAPPEESLALSECYHLLQNARRRAVIRYLDGRTGTVDVGTLSDHLVRQEAEEPITSQERHRVYVALYQTHLPKLADFDVVEYDKDRGTVRGTSLIPVLAGRMEVDSADADRGRQWQTVVTGTLIALAVLTAVLSAGSGASSIWLTGGMALATVGHGLSGRRGGRGP